MKYQASRTTRFLIACYSWCNRSGILQFPLVRWTFEHSYFLYKKLAGDPYAQFLARHQARIPPGHFFDVGANLGYMTQLFKTVLAPGYQVHAFEPETRNFTSLGRRFGHDPRTVLVQAAVGAENALVELWENPSHHADHRVRTASLDDVLGAELATSSFSQVPCVSLDNYVGDASIAPDSVSFIKIDVQGFEIPVLEGLRQLLQANPALLIGLEYDPQALAEAGFTPAGLARVLASLHLQAHTIARDGRLSPVPEDYFSAAGQVGHTDLLCKHQTAGVKLAL